MGNTLASSLCSKHFSSVDRAYQFGGCSIQSLCEQYGTPVFIYHSEILEEQFQSLRTTFPQKVEIFYSVKANPNRRILNFFLSKGCGLEVASGGEFSQAKQSGCPSHRILLAGPGKTDRELGYVLGQDIGEIHAESMNEIQRISKISRALGVEARVALRINPSEEAQGGAMRMGGKPSQFGIDEELLEESLECIHSQPSIKFCGIHLFSGTQILDETILLNQYYKAIALGKTVFSLTGKPLRTVDFGGGMGIPYFPGEQELNMVKLQKGISELFQTIEDDPAFSETRFIVEPGRFLVGPAGLYVVQVLDIKQSRGKTYVIVNGGMNHHLAASGNLGQVIKKNFPLVHFGPVSNGNIEVMDIVGPLCTPLDTLGRGVQLPMPRVGDFLGVFQSGAYARTASPLGFLSHVTPSEVMVAKGSSELIRRTGTFDDLVHDLT